MLVPVQYRRLMQYPHFDRYDLSALQMKLCTSAPFPAELTAEVFNRFAGGLIESYGMTEGGLSCILVAPEHRAQLHTVGRPAPGTRIKVLGANFKKVAPGEIGEWVGKSSVVLQG